MKIVEVECHRYTSDWYESPIVKIDLDKYIFFQLDYRGDKGVWYIIGHGTNDKGKWFQEELSVHGCFLKHAAKFVYEANQYRKENRREMVTRFNNLHYYTGFYEELQKLFETVKWIEEQEIGTK